VSLEDIDETKIDDRFECKVLLDKIGHEELIKALELGAQMGLLHQALAGASGPLFYKGWIQLITC